MRQLEHLEQSALFLWSRYNESKYPELACMFAIPNGGKRSIGTAVKMKREGVRPGVPDIFLAAARGGNFGLFIELKTKGGSVTPIQRAMHERLTENGYRVQVCFSMEQAKTALLMYLQGL